MFDIFKTVLSSLKRDIGKNFENIMISKISNRKHVKQQA